MLGYTFVLLIVLLAEANVFESFSKNRDYMNFHKMSSKILTQEVMDVLSKVDRKNYVPYHAYETLPVNLGYGAHFSPQQVNVIALEALKNHLKIGYTAMDIGCGTGYVTVCMALLVGETGKVVGIDHIKELVEYAKKSVKKDRPELLKNQRILFLETDGRNGAPHEGPFDAIHIGAYTEKVPTKLMLQLSRGGRMVLPIIDYNRQDMNTIVMTAVDKLHNGTVVITPLERLRQNIIVDFLDYKEKQMGP